jgi:hypothetical protein
LAAEGVLVALLLAGAVQVESAVPCPTGAEVEARLAPLLTPAPGPPDRALIGGAGGRLTLTLVRPDGSAVVERQLEARGSCADLAGVLALMVAVWHAQQHPELPLAPTLATPAPSPPRLLSLEARTQLFASLAGPTLSPGAMLSAILWRRSWGLGLSLSGTTLREQALGRGTAAWTRGALGLGPARRLLARPVSIDLRVEALAGLTLGRGSGYMRDDTPTAWTYGGGAGLEVSRAWGALVLCAGASGALWQAQELLVDVSGDRRPLPQAEARAGAGLGFRFDL